MKNHNNAQFPNRFIKISLLVIFFIIILLALCTLFPAPRPSPPGWDETHISFESDEDMVSYCGCLFFNTDKLNISHSTRCLLFNSAQDYDIGNWSSLEVSYIISGDDSQFSMFVYPNELSTTDGFPVRNLEIREIKLNGISIMYQEFKDHLYSYRALFAYDGYTYELTLYSPSDPNILIEYLQRVLPSLGNWAFIDLWSSI